MREEGEWKVGRGVESQRSDEWARGKLNLQGHAAAAAAVEEEGDAEAKKVCCL